MFRCGGHEVMGKLPGVQVYVNVTFVVFQPAALGGGNAETAMVGGTTTVKLTALLDAEPTVTMTLPVVAPFGTVTAMLDALHPDPVKLAEVPLNFTVLVPWAAPKLAPETVTAVPTEPDVRDNELMDGFVTAK